MICRCLGNKTSIFMFFNDSWFLEAPFFSSTLQLHQLRCQEGSKMVPEIMAKAKEKGVAPWHQIPSSIAFFHSFRCNQFNKTLSWWWNRPTFSPLKNAGRMRIRAFWMLSRIWFAEHFGLWPACGYLEIAPSSRCQGNCTAHWLCLFLEVWRGLDRLPLSLWLQGRSKTWWRSWPLQCSTESQERLCKKYGSVPSTKEEQYIKICGRFPQEMRKKAMKTLVSVANYIAEMDQRNIEKGIPN